MDKQQNNIYHIPIITPLRGIAAVSVCLFHFLCGDYPILPGNNWLKILASHGERGVEAFFVISGFIIPYSLSLKFYRIRDFFSFFLRRIKRLEPPYVACVAIILFNYYFLSLSPPFRGSPFTLELGELLSHFIYANNILHYSWLNPVFWTLAIELQFYLFMGICFPLLRVRKFEIRTFFLLLFVPLAFSLKDADQYLLMWLPLFGLGIASFQFYTRAIDWKRFALVFTTLATASALFIGVAQAIAGISTAIIILCFRNRELPNIYKPLTWLGTISYSLYLLHVPIGVRFIVTFQRDTNGMISRYGLILSALLLSIFASYLLWFFIEQPAKKWSRR